MSASLQCSSVSVGVGAKILFSGLDITVAAGDVVGLVGPNGAGKSTLLRVLAGQLPPLSGGVRLHPASADVGWLPQVEEASGETVAELIRRRSGVADADAEFLAASEALGAGGDPAADRYAAALDRWLSRGAADAPERIARVADDLGLTELLDRPLSALSGGQRARAALAALLASQYDLLLLDEPTNDLDAQGLQRLEDFLAAARVGIVVVSHDRELLARTVTAVVEIDASARSVQVFGGSFDAYVTERDRARERAHEAYAEYSTIATDLATQARRERQWADSGSRADRRDRTEPDRSLRNRRAERAEQRATRASVTERQLDRLEPVEQPRKQWQLQFEIAAAPRGSEVVCVLREAEYAAPAPPPATHAPAEAPGTPTTPASPRFRLGPISAQINAGDRIGITGANGSGKTTLLHLITGELAPTAGAVTRGAIAIGAVDQARTHLDPDKPLVEAVRALVPEANPQEIRTLVAKFGFRGDEPLRAVGSLSPGEQTRAALAVLQARATNVLVLDEPTNHLDLPALEQLEQALGQFRGTLLLVSHDRRLLDAVRLTRRWTLFQGRLTES